MNYIHINILVLTFLDVLLPPQTQEWTNTSMNNGINAVVFLIFKHRQLDRVQYFLIL
jgi:hypothetical protein